MGLRPLTKAAEIAEAFNFLSGRLKKGSHTFERTLGWQGGHGRYRIYWQKSHGFWASFDAEKDRHLCFLGTADPRGARQMRIICQIDPPRSGVNRALAGVFARGINGLVYVAHSGRVGGGRPGIGKKGFLASYRGDNRETIFWPDGKVSEALVIGELNGTRLLPEIAHFVNEAARFKATATKVAPQNLAQRAINQYMPEFIGKRKSYGIYREIESNARHGLVIDALIKEIRKLGIPCGNDRPRDVFVLNRNGKVQILFEAKTDLTSTSIYDAIGQLMYHGALEPKVPRRILVVPGTPKPRTQSVLKLLKIDVLPYRFSKSSVRFPLFKRLLR